MNKRVLKKYLERPELVALLVLVVLIGYFQYSSGGLFLSEYNLRGILSLLPELTILALGFSLLIIAGEFDLSIGSMMAFMPMLIVVLIGTGISFWLAFIIGCVAATCIGLFTGWIVLRFEIPSFIASLGMLFVLRSLTVVLYSGDSVPILPTDAPSWAFSDYIGPIRISVVWMLALAAAFYVLLERTNFGNWIRATGSAVDSAKAMGIPTNKVKLVCFCLSALCAGLAGMIQVVRIGSPLPSMGETMELQAIAAAVIGGIALFGGLGSVLGVVIGMCIIRTIDAGMIMSRVDASWFKFALGAMLVLAVIMNTGLRNWAQRIKAETGK
jgi:simple sugar transport system permease protein